jgi:hypothetical protein
MTEQKSRKYGRIKKWPKITQNGPMKKMADTHVVFSVFGVLN